MRDPSRWQEIKNCARTQQSRASDFKLALLNLFFGNVEKRRVIPGKYLHHARSRELKLNILHLFWSHLHANLDTHQEVLPVSKEDL